MNLGTTIAIFLIVAAILLMLFCLLLKCFNYRLRKKLQKAARKFGELQSDDWYLDCKWDGAYDKFCQFRQNNNSQPLKETLVDEDILIQMHEIRKMFDISNNIYGNSNLREKLYGEDFSRSLTSPSTTPMTHHRPDRLNFAQEDVVSTQRSKDQLYSFIKTLILYNQEGLHLLEVTPLSLSKQGSQIDLNKKVQQTFSGENQRILEDLLQSYGYQLNVYGCSKVVCELNISGLKEGRVYSFKNLQTREQKEEISLQEYYELLSSVKQNPQQLS